MNPETKQESKTSGLDIVINLLGVLAIASMAVGVAAGRFPEVNKVIPDSWSPNLMLGGWIFIGLYVLGIAYQSRQALVQVLKSERTQQSGNLVLQVVLALVIVGFLNYLGTRHHKRWDFTANKQFSLSEQTVKVIKDLPGKVTVTMFVSPADKSQQASKDLWQEYAYQDSDKVEFKPIDADRNPKEVYKYLNSLPKDQQGKVLENGQVRLGTMLLSYKGNLTPVTGMNEQDFTSALIKATRATQKVVYWLDGHGEVDSEAFGPEGMSGIKQALEKQNYKIDKLTLYAVRKVPADATALVVAAPSKPYSADEVAELSRYVKEGGKVFLELRPGVKTGLEKWLQDDFAVTPQDDLVLELNPSLTASFNPTMVAVMKYQFHAITQSFQNYRIPTVFVQTQSFKVADKKPEGIQIDSLAETDDKAEGRVIGGEDLNAALSRSFDEKKDVKGPLKLALAITATHKNPHGVANASGSAQPLDLKGRVVVFGTPYFASNSLSRQMSNIGNVDFALASLNWLAEEEALVSIPPKNQENRTVDLIGNAPRKVFLGAGVVPPLVLLIFGAVVWWRRR